MDNIPIHQLFGNQTRDKNILGFADIPLSPTLSLPLETILSHLCKKETHLPNLTRKEVVSKRLHMTFPLNQAFGTRNALDVYQAANFPWFQHCSSKSLQLRKSWLERWPWKRKPDNSPSWQSLKAKSELFFLVIWKTRDRISMMKYQLAQRNLSYLLQFKPVVNESITMNVLVITQSYYKPSQPQLSSFTVGVWHISLQTLCKWHRNKLVTKASPGSHSAQRLSPGFLISQDTIRPCNPDINPEVGDANKQVHDGDGDDHGDYAGCIQYTMYIM